jgi:hypothetical protein
MATSKRCPTCGHPVRVVGNTTLLYEPVEQQELARLRFLHDLDHKLVDHFRTERDRLQEELSDCVRDCQKAGERSERVLELLCNVATFLRTTRAE